VHRTLVQWHLKICQQRSSDAGARGLVLFTYHQQAYRSCLTRSQPPRGRWCDGVRQRSCPLGLSRLLSLEFYLPTCLLKSQDLVPRVIHIRDTLTVDGNEPSSRVLGYRRYTARHSSSIVYSSVMLSISDAANKQCFSTDAWTFSNCTF